MTQQQAGQNPNQPQPKDYIVIKFDNGSINGVSKEVWQSGYCNTVENWSAIAAVQACNEFEAGCKFVLDGYSGILNKDALYKLLKFYLEENNWKFDEYLSEVDEDDFLSLDGLLEESVLDGLIRVEVEDDVVVYESK